MGIHSVAVYSDADQKAMHVRMADEAVWIGPAPAAQSYLNISRILQAAVESKAQAIHPGYGFLAENAGFARMVRESGLVFIGPPTEAIQAMGDKAEARRRMQAAGVPVVPGYQDEDDNDSLLRAAHEIGYPLFVKAAAGGGGKGMRVVNDATDLSGAIGAARREAQHAFGDDRLILEAYLPRARHIEFQILADQHGAMVHLFERECSVQRRRQKIIEETPSPCLDDRLRAAMSAAALAAARVVEYTNAGTVEFIFDPHQHRFYFLEMNTRLQVEHPVTELVTGIDLVQWQIRIAAGEHLPVRQEQLVQRGHAIECRLYAETVENDFLPAVGPLLRFIEPAGPGIRVDSGFTSGDEITIHYDPLIAKVTAFAEDRPSAIRRMLSALSSTVLLGTPSNTHFLVEVLKSDDFQHGRVHTNWVEEIFQGQRAPVSEPAPAVLIAAALKEILSEKNPKADSALRNIDPYSPWDLNDRFRPGGPQ